MTTSELTELLVACTARISSASTHLGTGFFVAPGRLLTAAHVVANDLKPKALAYRQSHRCSSGGEVTASAPYLPPTVTSIDRSRGRPPPLEVT